MPVPFRRITPETVIAAFVSAFVALMAAGYLIDAIGGAMHPFLLGLAAAAGGAAAFAACREPSPPPAGSLVLFAAVVAGTFGYLIWLASPSLLPVTIGPDLVHHLLLIHVIQRTHHLVHGDALRPYLLEMVNYTPGAHIAAAALAGWLRVDALRLLFPLTAAFAAVKAGVIYTLALRVIDERGERPGAALYALAAPVLLLVPSAYALGSFLHFYFFAQVVSETFAIAMVLAAMTWARTGDRRHLWLASACGVGVVLSWPVWIGPALAAVFVVTVAASPSMRARIAAAAIVAGPAAVFALFHASMHPGGASIIGSSGAVTRPSTETVGAAFAALGLIGAFLAARPEPSRGARPEPSRGARPEPSRGAARPLVVLLAVTGLQALALAAFDWRAASTSFYLPLKMVYLAVLPGAVLGALALAAASATIASRLPVLRRVVPLVPLIAALLLVRGRIPLQRQHGPLSEPSLAAGLWARGAVPPACVDYFARHWLTGYWLHLDVLGNPRLSDRMRAETFDFPDVVGKWIQGKGLPYAIVEDLAAVPRDARVDMRVLREFPPAALVQNTRPDATESSPCRGK